MIMKHLCSLAQVNDWDGKRTVGFPTNWIRIKSRKFGTLLADNLFFLNSEFKRMSDEMGLSDSQKVKFKQ